MSDREPRVWVRRGWFFWQAIWVDHPPANTEAWDLWEVGA